MEAEAVVVKSLRTSGGISELVDAGERASAPGEALEEAGDGPWFDAEEPCVPFAEPLASGALEEWGVERSLALRLSLWRSVVEIWYCVTASTR